ncbi:hypothetical protein LTR29_000104 [Friedmanniomyces endolithicus]|nr:hypothetical protein LTS09_009584 [Friedmanniomyces endolithicus]KAK0948472.1 hypothetical protein LTR29_000104 [Friedmanniomyces endolithicus]
MADQDSDNSPHLSATDDRFMPTRGSSGSDSCTFTDYGLRRALQRSILRPAMPTTKRDEKDAEYIERVAEHRQRLLDQLHGTERVFNDVDEERNVNEDRIQAIWLHAAWLRASNNLQRAERNYVIFMDDVKLLMEMPPISRADLYSEVTVKRLQAHHDLKVADAIEDALLEPSDRPGFELAKLKTEVRDLKVLLTEASRQFTWAQEEINKMRGQNVAALQKHVMTTENLQRELHGLHMRVEELVQVNEEYDVETTRQNELLRQLRSAARQSPVKKADVLEPSKARTEQSERGSDDNRSAHTARTRPSSPHQGSGFHVSDAATLGDIGNAESLRHSQSVRTVCSWHAPETCRVATPGEQARGKYCTITERN